MHIYFCFLKWTYLKCHQEDGYLLPNFVIVSPSESPLGQGSSGGWVQNPDVQKSFQPGRRSLSMMEASPCLYRLPLQQIIYNYILHIIILGICHMIAGFKKKCLRYAYLSIVSVFKNKHREKRQPRWNRNVTPTGSPLSYRRAV